MLIMRSVPVVGEESIEIARSYDGVTDCLLLDSHRESDRQIGALGVTHDWTISHRIVELLRTPVSPVLDISGDAIPQEPGIHEARLCRISDNPARC
jgi:phosphoribosylanthranilate isomerase